MPGMSEGFALCESACSLPARLVVLDLLGADRCLLALHAM